MVKSGLLKKSLLILGMPVLASAAFKYWNPPQNIPPPKTLSELGVYQNITALPIQMKKLDTNLFHYEVNSALWSDGSHKNRWIMLKNRNKANNAGSIKYEEQNDYWTYPDSAVFLKNFAIDTNGLDTNSRVLWETRVLLNIKDTIDQTVSDHWYGYSYKWRQNQIEADLVDTAHGLDTAIRVWPNGIGAGKTSVMKKWHFPTIYQCGTCHRSGMADTTHGRAVLGFFGAQLNRPHPDVANINQLEYFFNKKILTGTKSNWDAATTPHWRGIDDSTATVDLRARSYIAANCSGCHGRRGIANSATQGVELNYDFFQMQAQMEFRDHMVGWGWNLDTIPPIYYPKNDPANVTHGDSAHIIPALIVPGYPNKSVLIFRQKSRNTMPIDSSDAYNAIHEQMPPLATFEVNTPAISLLERWVREMQPLPVDSTGNVGIVHGASARALLKSPVIRGGLVILPADFAATSNLSVKLTGINGRTFDLKAAGHNAFALPRGLPKGVYIIRVGEQNFTRYLF
jgi:hypothetical protein